MADEPKLGVTGKRGNAGKGRQKGVPNKVNALLKDQILAALDKAGGIEYLTMQALENPASFLGLVGKVLPMQITGPQPDGAHKLVITWEE